MRIPKALVDEIVAHAREDLPNECCGLVGGVGEEARSAHKVANAAVSPLRYEMDPKGQLDAYNAIEEAGEELVAIYHSHTKSPAYPSQTDVNQAVAWPDQVYLIVSLADRDEPDLKGYLLKDLRIADVEIVVT
jgi:proteasome lid subunit RPN8/RPN11